ncbi:MAG TPA: hypothetical protein VEA99_07685, partial [Gemmatimonadaceae bacterium]|nr:hypothetical protein [Gemmatimonadaceae bacterium]
MRFTVLHAGVPIGHVELAARDLVAGRLAATEALDPLLPTVRAGSRALLALGFFGAASPTSDADGEALAAAAALRFDLVDENGALAPATFVNLIETEDERVVV